MSDGFVEVRVLDNFYQTSSYYPMPVILVTTISESGKTNIGPYSLCFPFGIAELQLTGPEYLLDLADQSPRFGLQHARHLHTDGRRS